jgi:hypothetical protein
MEEPAWSQEARAQAAEWSRSADHGQVDGTVTTGTRAVQPVVSRRDLPPRGYTGRLAESTSAGAGYTRVLTAQTVGPPQGQTGELTTQADAPAARGYAGELTADAGAGYSHDLFAGQY